MIITRVRHDWPENKGFHMIRPNGHSEYTFLHFSTPVEIELEGKHILVHAGGCIIYAPGVPQNFRCEKALVHNWFHANSSFGELLKTYNIPVNRVLYPNDTSYISGMLQAMELEFFSNILYRDEMLNHSLHTFLVRFSRSLCEASVKDILPRKDQSKLSQVRQYILSHPEKRWTVAEMAVMAQLSQSRFNAVYKAVFGTTPMQDVIDSRVSRARSILLVQEGLSISEISEILGYNDQYHFIRQFKAVTGMTPGAYRKKNH